MGALWSRLDTEQKEIFRRSVEDLVCIVQQQNVELAELIQQRFTQLNSEEVLELQMENILQDFGLNRTSRRERGYNVISNFISQFNQQQVITKAFIEKQRLKWGEDSSSFWENANCSTGLTSTSISQLWRCIGDIKVADSLNLIRRRISFVLFYRLQEQIKTRIRKLITDDKRKLPSGVDPRSLVKTIIVENIYNPGTASEKAKFTTGGNVN